MDLFAWDASSDSFSPDDPSEIVSRSSRLETVGRLTGWGSDGLVEELGSRASFLEDLAARRMLGYRELAGEFSSWYRRRYLSGPAAEATDGRKGLGTDP